MRKASGIGTAGLWEELLSEPDPDVISRSRKASFGCDVVLIKVNLTDVGALFQLCSYLQSSNAVDERALIPIDRSICEASHDVSATSESVDSHESLRLEAIGTAGTINGFT